MTEQLIQQLLLTDTLNPHATRQDVIDIRRFEMPKGQNARTTAFLDNVPLSAYCVQEKLDGVLLIHCGKTTYTKTGNVVHAPKFFTEAAFTPVPMVGELYAGPGQRSQTADLLKYRRGSEQRAISGWERHRFVVYDIPGLGAMPYHERHRHLSSFVECWNNKVLELQVHPPQLQHSALPLQCIRSYPGHEWRHIFREVILQSPNRQFPPWGPSERGIYDSKTLQDNATDELKDIPCGEGLMFHRLDSPWCGRISGLPYKYEDIVGEDGNILDGVIGGGGQHRGPTLVKCKPHLISVGVIVGPPRAIVHMSEAYRPSTIDCNGYKLLRLSSHATGAIVAPLADDRHPEGYTIPVRWLHPKRWQSVVLKVYIPLRTNMTQILQNLGLGQVLPFYFISMRGQLGQPEWPVALLGSHPLNTLHLRAIWRALAAQGDDLPRLKKLYQQLKREMFETMGKLSVNGVLADTCLPLFPPCAWPFSRMLTISAFTAMQHPYLLPKFPSPVPDSNWQLPPGAAKEGYKNFQKTNDKILFRAIQITKMHDARFQETILWQYVTNQGLSVIRKVRNLHILMLVLYTLRARCCLNILSNSCVSGADGLAFQRCARINPDRNNSLLCRWVDIAPVTLMKAIYTLTDNDRAMWYDALVENIANFPIILSCVAYCWLALLEHAPDVLDREYNDIVTLGQYEDEVIKYQPYDIGIFYRIIQEAMEVAESCCNNAIPGTWDKDNASGSDIMLFCIIRLIFNCYTDKKPTALPEVDAVVETVTGYLREYVYTQNCTTNPHARPQQRVESGDVNKMKDGSKLLHKKLLHKYEFLNLELDPVTLLPCGHMVEPIVQPRPASAPILSGDITAARMHRAIDALLT